MGQCIACGKSEADIGRDTPQYRQSVYPDPMFPFLPLSAYLLICRECSILLGSIQNSPGDRALQNEIKRIVENELRMVSNRQAEIVRARDMLAARQQEQARDAHRARLRAFQANQGAQMGGAQVPAVAPVRRAPLPMYSRVSGVPTEVSVPASVSGQRQRPAGTFQRLGTFLGLRSSRPTPSIAQSVASSRNTTVSPGACCICLETAHSRDNHVGILSCCQKRMHFTCAAPIQERGNRRFRTGVPFLCPECRNPAAHLQPRELPPNVEPYEHSDYV